MNLVLVKPVRGGKVVHTPVCRHAVNAADRSDWEWAADKPLSTIRLAVVTFMYHPCKRCDPLQEK